MTPGNTPAVILCHMCTNVDTCIVSNSSGCECIASAAAWGPRGGVDAGCLGGAGEAPVGVLLVVGLQRGQEHDAQLKGPDEQLRALHHCWHTLVHLRDAVCPTQQFLAVGLGMHQGSLKGRKLPTP